MVDLLYICTQCGLRILAGLHDYVFCPACGSPDATVRPIEFGELPEEERQQRLARLKQATDLARQLYPDVVRTVIGE